MHCACQESRTKSKNGSSSFNVLGRLVNGLKNQLAPTLIIYDSPSTIPVEHPVNILHSIDIIRRQEESRHKEHLHVSRSTPKSTSVDIPLRLTPDSIFPTNLPNPILQIQPSLLRMYSTVSCPGRAYTLNALTAEQSCPVVPDRPQLMMWVERYSRERGRA